MKGRAADLTLLQRWAVVVAVGLLHLVVMGGLLRISMAPASTSSRETSLQVDWIANAEPVEAVTAVSPSLPTPPQPKLAPVSPLPTEPVPLLAAAEAFPSQAMTAQSVSTVDDGSPTRPAEAASDMPASANGAATTAPPAAAPLPKNLPAESVQYLVPPAPVYPRLSRRQGETGRVLVRVYIDETGLPRSVQLSASSGHGRLDDAALQAVQQARFKPYAENGRPMGGWAFIPLTFDLEKSP